MKSRILLRTPSGIGALDEAAPGKVGTSVEALSQDTSCFASPPV